METAKSARGLAVDGYLKAMEVSAKTGMNVTTIYRWIDAGKVKGMTSAGHRYVEIESLIKHLGEEAAAAVGLVSSEKKRKGT